MKQGIKIIIIKKHRSKEGEESKKTVKKERGKEKKNYSPKTGQYC
jgi:hypothetical protein